MGISDTLKEIGWSQDLISAVEAVSKKVSEGAISFTTIDANAYLKVTSLDSTSLELSARNVHEATTLLIKG